MQTSQNLSLTDGIYYAKVQVQDLAGNISTSPAISFTIDSIAPAAPTNISVNQGNIIDITTEFSVTVAGSGGISESGTLVSYSISSSSGTISGSGVVDSFGSFHFLGINVSTLADGILNYTLYLTDRAGNGLSSTAGTIGKSVVPAAGNLLFLSGAYSNTGSTNLQISAAKPVTYILMGSGIIETITGSLASSGSIVVPVMLSANDGNKTVQVSFTDEATIETTTVASIILDTTPPILSIDSHLNGAQVTGFTTLMTGSIFDMNGVANATLNTISLPSFSNWSKIVNLSGGNNAFILTAMDRAGNSTSLSISVERMIALSNFLTSPLPTGMRIDFDTDLSATGVVDYGTSSGNLNLTKDTISLDGLHHSVMLTGLTMDTPYYYTSQGSSS